MSEQQPSAPAANAPAQGGEPKSKKQQNKEAKKAQKEAQKSAKQGQQQQQQQPAEQLNPDVAGDLPLIRSQQQTNRVWNNVRELDETKNGQTVLLRGRLHSSRGKGNLCFIVIREREFTVQAVLEKNEVISKAVLKFASSIPSESIIDVEGVVRTVPQPVLSTTQQKVELAVTKIFVVSRAANLPLLVDDAARPQPLIDAQEAEIEALEKQLAAVLLQDQSSEAVKADLAALQKRRAEAQKYVVVSQDTRLDNRVIDLRTPANQAIYKVQSAVCQLFREYLIQNGFTEIHTPKIISAASEGGASVFKLKYFNGDAFLAQSPQLYKQMAICGDLDRVFEIGPVFRAENSNTHRHLTEFVGLDMEMAFKEHYHEVLYTLGNLFNHIFEGLETRWGRELQIISQQYPFEPLKFLRPPLRLTFPEAIAMLHEAGSDAQPLEDLSTPQERLLGKLVRAKYNTDFYMLDKFPKNARPFYTMPDPADERYTNSYDLFIRGEEVMSGSQRVHDPVMLEARAREFGVEIRTIQAYIDAFKYGAPPHAGGGVGLERVVMLYLGLGNIRRTSMFPRDPARLTP